MAKKERFVVLNKDMDETLGEVRSKKALLRGIAESMAEWEADTVYIAKVIKKISLSIDIEDM